MSGHAASDIQSTVKRFDKPERVLVFEQGRLELITLGGKTIGRGSYSPGWRWSRREEAASVNRSEPPEHVGLVLSGRARVVTHDGTEIELVAGDLFHIATEFDEWVVGYRPCEILYLSGVEALIKHVYR